MKNEPRVFIDDVNEERASDFEKISVLLFS